MNMYKSRILVSGIEEQYDYLHDIYANKKFIDIIYCDAADNRFCKRVKIGSVMPIFGNTVQTASCIIWYLLILQEYNRNNKYHTASNVKAKIYSQSIHTISMDSIPIVIVKHTIPINWQEE